MKKNPKEKEFVARLQKPTIKDPRLLIGIFLIIISIVSVGLVLRMGNKTDTFVVAKTDITVGQKISSDDVVLVEAKMDDAQKASYLSSTQHVSEQYATSFVKAGEFLATTDVEASPTDSRRKATIILESNAAATLNIGDRVDIWVARQQDNAQNYDSPETVMIGAEVANKTSDESILGGTGNTAVTVLVTEEALPRILEAVNNDSKINLIPTNYSRQSGDL